MRAATFEQSTELFVTSDSATSSSSRSLAEAAEDPHTVSTSPAVFAIASTPAAASSDTGSSTASPVVLPVASSSSSVTSVAAGATVLTLTMFVSNAGNYVVNVLLGRWLTPSEFSDATLMVTLMLVATALAISLQLIAAKLVSDDNETAIAWLCTRALYAGVALAVVLIGTSGALSSFFNTQSPWPFVVLGLGMPFYTVAAVGRGVLQGRFAFRSLAASFGIEMVIRAVFSIGLVAAGFGVSGATIGLALSFMATWLAVRRTTAMHWAKAQPKLVRSVSSIAKPVALLLVAQVIINNADVLFSKRFLDAQAAGRYGAVALIGRGVFFASWAVAMAVFPAAAAQTTPVGKADRLLMTALGAVISIGLVAAGGSYFLGDTALGMVFGPAYSGLATPLALYAVVTTLFAVSNLFATYHLSTGNSTPSAMLLLGGLLQSILLFAKHGSIDDLVRMQLIAMLALTLCVTGYHFLRASTSPASTLPISSPPIKAPLDAKAATS
jgi:O-antigen/teichoic acid export membrane protein